jgi:hypothetical protein
MVCLNAGTLSKSLRVRCFHADRDLRHRIPTAAQFPRQDSAGCNAFIHCLHEIRRSQAAETNCDEDNCMQSRMARRRLTGAKSRCLSDPGGTAGIGEMVETPHGGENDDTSANVPFGGRPK